MKYAMTCRFCDRYIEARTDEKLVKKVRDHLEKRHYYKVDGFVRSRAKREGTRLSATQVDQIKDDYARLEAKARRLHPKAPWMLFTLKYRGAIQATASVSELINPAEKSVAQPASHNYPSPRSQAQQVAELARHSDQESHAAASESIRSAAHGDDAGLASTESQRSWWRRLFDA